MAERVTTKDALKKIDEQLECSICFELLKQPKVLPCYHVFCKSPCLEKLVTRDGCSLTCPTCRHIVPLTEEGVAGLQSDFRTDQLKEVRDTFNKAEEHTERQCGSCEDETATGYCRDCQEFICKECQVAHRRLKITKHHQIVSLDDQNAEEAAHPTLHKKIPHCPKHPENALKIYCETCFVLICNDCTIRLHRDHNYDLLADVFPKHKEELVSSLKPLKQKLDKVQQALKVFDTRTNEIDCQKATLEADIHKEIDQQHQLLDQRRVELVDKLDMLAQQKKKNLAAQRDQVESTQAKLTSCLEYAENSLQTCTESEVLAMKAPVLERIKQIQFDLDTLQPQTEADLELQNTTGHFQHTWPGFLEIIERGSASLDHSQIQGDALREAKTGEQKVLVFQARTKERKQYEGKLNLTAELVHIKGKDRVECEVVKQQNGEHKISYRPVKRGKHELCLTVNGNPARGSPFPIAVTPSHQSLRKPVRVIRGLKGPRGTAVNSKGHIVVVERNGSCISVLTPEGEKVRTFDTSGPANADLYGVTIDSDDNLYVTGYNHQVQKFDSEGRFVTAVGSRGSGNLQFFNPFDLCYNHRDNNLYIVDQSNHRIQVLTTDLKFVRSFGTRGTGNGQFRNPLCVAVDDANNLYVTDSYNQRVQALTTKGQFLRAFSRKFKGQKLYYPYAIAIDSSNTVYVSENGPNCVSVFTCKGSYISTFGGEGSKEGQFRSIYGLSISHSDSLIVSDEDNQQLQIY